jgi:hypothetical protein
VRPVEEAVLSTSSLVLSRLGATWHLVGYVSFSAAKYCCSCCACTRCAALDIPLGMLCSAGPQPVARQGALPCQSPAWPSRPQSHGSLTSSSQLQIERHQPAGGPCGSSSAGAALLTAASTMCCSLTRCCMQPQREMVTLHQLPLVPHHQSREGEGGCLCVTHP